MSTLQYKAILRWRKTKRALVEAGGSQCVNLILFIFAAGKLVTVTGTAVRALGMQPLTTAVYFLTRI